MPDSAADVTAAQTQPDAPQIPHAGGIAASQPAAEPEAAGHDKQEQPGAAKPPPAEHSTLGEGVYDQASGLTYFSSAGCFWDGDRLWGDAATGQWWTQQGNGSYEPVA